MYDLRPNLILAFHGCDRTTRDGLVLGTLPPKPSENAYGWLGSGMYFWENDPDRAMEWAVLQSEKPFGREERIVEPAVVGAVISLDNCLDLLVSRNIQLVQLAHAKYMEMAANSSSMAIPKNAGGKDLRMRNLDCAVVNFLHDMISQNSSGEYGVPILAGLHSFDSVRAMFPEGEPIYPGAGFRKQNHVQLCIRNSDCIKGFFVPRERVGMIVE